MTDTLEPDLDASMRKLDAFLADNRQLEALNARLASFNMFSVLRIERAEIRHSNVLAWLLTPDGTHGLGASFLQRFLSRILMECEVRDVKLTPAKVELMRLGDVDVRREWKNIDILVHSREHKWCLLIENKIDSKERKGQLSKGKAAVRHEYPGCEVVPVLLTVEGEEPSEAGLEGGYVAFSHVQVLEVAEQIIEQHKARIPRDAGVFLKHYLDVLRRITMQDEELVGLCKKIYRKHREAISLIVDYGKSSAVLDACKEVLPQLQCDYLTRWAGRIWFLPSEVPVHNLAPLSSWTHLGKAVAVACWFQYVQQKGRLYVKMEVGPISDLAVRDRLRDAIRKAGFSFWGRSDKYTVIASKGKKLQTDKDGSPDDSPEYVKKVAGEIWEDLWEKKGGSKITGVLRDFDWTT